ncbi:MAG: cystathionine gamma-synthase family protein [Alphaproteobacteria bacterium]|nr:cystathionine gamma-synthase family protein [Alphaproteobacteria bacterium]
MVGPPPRTSSKRRAQHAFVLLGVRPSVARSGCASVRGARRDRARYLGAREVEVKRRHSGDDHEFNPETLALGLGYDPTLSEGAVKPPVFLTSTFQFASADDGRRFFELAYGLRSPGPAEVPGLIYSRLNNPNLQIFEERMAAWDRTEKGLSFASGMAAISTTCLALLRPGDVVIHSAPIYGGTHFLLEHILPPLGIRAVAVPAGPDTASEVARVAREVGEDAVRLVLLETPANPSIAMVDIRAVAEVARRLSEDRAAERRAVVAVDNTFLGPVFQRPADHGADLVVYSATKFIGGHSDLVAGVVTGEAALIDAIGVYRTILGTMPNPFTGWLLLRSLETVSVRMRRQAKSAAKLAELLAAHPKVVRVHHPTLLPEGSREREIWERQCSGAGSLIAFEVQGGRDAAYRLLDRFEVFRLAVSLGGTESLVEHPQTMTHADVPPEQLALHGVTDGLVRMSVGLEHLSDLKRDLRFGLEAV